MICRLAPVNLLIRSSHRPFVHKDEQGKVKEALPTYKKKNNKAVCPDVLLFFSLERDLIWLPQGPMYTWLTILFRSILEISVEAVYYKLLAHDLNEETKI